MFFLFMEKWITRESVPFVGESHISSARIYAHQIHVPAARVSQLERLQQLYAVCWWYATYSHHKVCGHEVFTYGTQLSDEKHIV